jgi:short chain dehydrogenase
VADSLWDTPLADRMAQTGRAVMEERLLQALLADLADYELMERATAKRLVSDGYGVIVNYAADADGTESVVSVITGTGGKAIAVKADVASEDDAEAMFDRATELTGPVTAPTRRERRDRVVAAITRGVFRHGQRYHRIRRTLTSDTSFRILQASVGS